MNHIIENPKHKQALQDFKPGVGMSYDLESDVCDYLFSNGSIRNYNMDASEYCAERLVDELGMEA